MVGIYTTSYHVYYKLNKLSNACSVPKV